MKTPLEIFSLHLKKKGLRLTHERQELLELILSIKGHFSPEDVLKKVRERHLPISRATVYRIIPVLSEAEVIQQSLHSAQGQALFEVKWNKRHHDHLICLSCGKIIEFRNETIETLQKEIASRHGFTLEDHTMELFGQCPQCASTLN